MIERVAMATTLLFELEFLVEVIQKYYIRKL